MQANSETIKVNNTIIFRCDEWRDGNKSEFDGQVQVVREKGLMSFTLVAIALEMTSSRSVTLSRSWIKDDL